MQHKRHLILAAGVTSVVTGVMFMVAPGHADAGWLRLLGALWLSSGVLWLAAYTFGLRRPRA